MNPELIQPWQSARMTQGGIRALTAALPADEATLVAWVDALVRDGRDHAVTALVLAALAGSRPLPAALLPRVMPLLLTPGDVVAAALHSRGDVLSALLQTVRDSATGWERHTLLLLCAGWIWKHREPTTVLPADLIRLARHAAREAATSEVALLNLFTLADLLDHKDLRTVVSSVAPPPPPSLIQGMGRWFAEGFKTPLSHLAEQADTVLHEGTTARRAVARTGRNDPCPCGSGKKYKRCCYDKDQDRLRHSSSVPGRTREELWEDPEPFLTLEQVDALRSHQLSRLRIDRVRPEVQGPVLERLAVFRQVDAFLAAWETVGWREDLERAWDQCEMEVVKQRLPDALRRLLAVRGWDVQHPMLSLPARLLLLRDQPEAVLPLLESRALAALRDPRNTDPIEIAYALLESPWPALGTFVGRGAAVTASPFDAMMLFDAMHAVRDDLDLPPEDPAEWLLDRDFSPPDDLEEADREAFDAARRDLELSNSELTRLRQQLQEARAQLERQERLGQRHRASPAADPPSAAPPAEGPTRALRERIESLKSELTSRHQERNALRQELAKALAEAEALRKQVRRPDTEHDAEHDAGEEQDLLDEEPLTQQPPRVPLFLPKARDAFKLLPAGVARTALGLVGRLAAGEPGAFVGTRRLRRNREIHRARVGQAYRLFFRLDTSQLEVVDLIHRRDLERWLKQSAP